MKNAIHSEVITRRNLPHWYVPGAAHFVTYRLAGTIPSAVLESWRIRRETSLRQQSTLEASSATHQERAHKQFFAAYDRYLDNNTQTSWLADPRVAAVIRKNLYFHHGKKYHLISYCIMPNHVHVLLTPLDIARDAHLSPGFSSEMDDGLSPLASIMHSLKSYTASKANEILKRSGIFWQSESYDHWVRDDEELARIVDYIAANPVMARQAAEPHLWLFCSAHDRFLFDGSKEGFLAFD